MNLRLFLFPFLLFPFFATAQVTLEIHSIEVLKGNMYIAIYDSEATFMDIDQAFQQKMLPVNAATLTHSLADLPTGNYAIALYHDENNNQELDTGFFGIPKEGYGFSNDATGRFGPPSFEAASFTISEKDTPQNIRIRLK